MCGFIATISKNGTPFPEDKLREMAAIIAHRGPDDEGFFSSGAVSLAFKRLKIIDLSANAHQPMHSSDGRHVIIFNGEIYNYREIRKELEGTGTAFKSDSDTEVLLNSYLRWGERCLDKFVGMFAFAILDTRDGSVFFARDQLGIKPLFIFDDSKHFILTSEIKTLLPYTDLKPDPDSFNEYLVFRSLPGERTMFKGARSLLPGHHGRISDGKMVLSRYFDISETFEKPHHLGFEEACEETEQMLEDSIRIHLRSDVELGVQLSGGVDSSLITALASKISGKRLHSFSISFDESKYDESEYQKRVSERYNTEHHDFRMDEDIFVSNIEKSIWHYEHPLNDPNSVATFHLAKRAKQFITVMLSGEGADESFLGYTKFLPDAIRRTRMRNILFRNPRLRDLLATLWPFEKGRALFQVTKYPPAMFALSYAKMDLVDGLLKGAFDEMKPRSLVSSIACGDSITETILQDEICDLPQWLYRADKMGMAASLEFRVPFCTTQIFEMANSLQYHIKMYGGERKAVLKKIAEKYIDKDQIYRKKIGFGIPIDDWINKNGRYYKLFEDTVNSMSFRSREFIDQKHFRQIYQAHKDGSYRETNSSFLWTYFNLELWYRIFFEGGWKDVIYNLESRI